MRALTKMVNDNIGSNIQSVPVQAYNDCVVLPKIKMNPIPWSNVTFEKPSYDQYILRYSDSNPSNIYFSITLINTSVTINDIKTDITYDESGRQNCNYTNSYDDKGRIESGAGNGGDFPTNPPLRILIFVEMVGYFYVDIDSQGNAKLST
jgi:hypothetical protein